MRRYYDDYNEDYERGYRDGRDSVLNEARKSKYDKIAEEIESTLKSQIGHSNDYEVVVENNKSRKSINVGFLFTLKHESYVEGY